MTTFRFTPRMETSFNEAWGRMAAASVNEGHFWTMVDTFRTKVDGETREAWAAFVACKVGVARMGA